MPELPEVLQQIISILVLVAFLLTHILPHLPPTVTEKIPNWVMFIVNYLAGQYKHAANAKTDINGNPREKTQNERHSESSSANTRSNS
ncbi:hypothetical protein [Vibrio harveyi]|uniref:hypothetical protein n=1 Tax=Vibrio harveyi group TaxID=717610 RepID=UPI0023805EE2|nr:hypothetical protein [Vibrio harveyi]